MEPHSRRVDSKPSGRLLSFEEAETERYSVVSSWFDAERMDAADITGELVGQRIVAGEDGHSVPFTSTNAYQVSGGVPGFLFAGDDGDSLWFWPEAEDIAFRFEPETARMLRRELSEGVSRLVSQGALVFCQKVDTVERQGEVLEFPLPREEAA